PVARDDQQRVAEIIDVADLPLAVRGAVEKRGLENGRGERHAILRRKRGSYRLAPLTDNNNMLGGIVRGTQGTMRSHVRTVVVLPLAAGLLALFFWKADLRGVLAEIRHARPEWLALSLATTFLNLVIRALRWQFLLEPLGTTGFGNVFRATAV